MAKLGVQYIHREQVNLNVPKKNVPKKTARYKPSRNNTIKKLKIMDSTGTTPDQTHPVVCATNARYIR